MSQRNKRQNRFDNDEPLPTKRRKGRPPTKGKIPPTTAVDDDDDGATSSTWQPRPIIDLKISSIYNRSAPEAPAELFRKDLISAMKLPDSEPLAADEYWVITDQWKQEWERGVQVPVNPDSLPEPTVSAKQHESFYTGRQDFKLPKNKFIRITKDENFSSEQHYLSNTPAMAEAACAYDLDQFDDTWLKIINGERALAGAPSITEDQFERVIEELEVRCWDKIQAMVKSEQGLGIEYDENVICDVCRSPDSEEANEMVFCDSCNICVHQACYGITAIPSGQWLCRTCSMGQRPDCVLCPNKGGAMKSTRSGHKWAHVSCALWIPEVSIGSVDRMEPITKISSIPASRWALICVLCRERVGACIQCSVKTCKTAYHVTCAFQHGLEMRAIIEDENAEDGVKLRSYCQKHSLNKSKKDKGPSNNNAGKSGSDEEDTKRKKQRRDMTSEEKTIVRKKRVQEIEAEFEKHVNIRDISCHLMDVDQEAIYCIYNYWIIKRKSLRNESLIPHKWDDVDMVEHKHEPADIEKMKMFVHLRQDLERVRNLCYMVSRREKLSRSFFKMREQTFHKQVSVLNEIKSNKLDDNVIKAVCRANNVRSVYDKAYSSDKSVILKLESILSGITGSGSASSSPTDDRVNNIDFNGQLKGKRQLTQSTNKRTHLNGVSVSSMPMSSIMFDSVYDTFSSESDFDATKSIKSSKSTTPSIRKKTAQKPLEKDTATKTDRRKRRVSAVSINRMKKTLDSSSDDDQLLVNEKRTPKNRSLRQMERELNRSKASGSESDELIPIRNSSGQHIGSAADTKKILTAIYSDSEESTDKEKTDHTASDSQQHSFRTKAAMKEFNVNSAKLLRDKDEETSPRIPMSKEIVKEKEAEESKKKNERDAKPAKDVKDVKNKKNNSTQDVSQTVQKDKKLDKDKFVEKLENEPPESKSKKNETKKDKPSDISVDLLVVPQRKAAKKASENMMRTTVAGPVKKDTKDDEKEKKDLKEPAKDVEKESTQQQPDSTPTKTPVTPQRPKGRPSKNAQKLKTPTKDKEPSVEPVADVKEKQKETKDKDIIVAYVPQRQAAKKAAEHIKSGLGKPAPDSQGNVQATVDEKPKAQPYYRTKSERRKEIGESSTSSSSDSSSSSSSDSEDEEASTVAKNSVKDAKSDKAKDLPFLNKDSKSSGSVTSNDSSDSDSESSSASNASESYKKRKRKPSVSSAKAIKQTPQKCRKDINNKKPNRELEQSASNTETFKRDEPSTKTPTTPKSIGRGGKRSSISCNRRQSADLRSGNLAKGAKTASETIETADKTTVASAEDSSKHTKSKQPYERKSSESSPTKQKQNLLNEQQPAGNDSPTKQSEGNSNKVDEAAKAVEHIYDNTSFDKESRKSSELSPKKREADKKLISAEPSLEQEIIERKAEHSSVNKLNKSTGNLDKLLSKRERDMKFISSPTTEAGSGHPVRDMEHQNVDIKAAQSVDIEIIDITGGDEKVGINLSTFNESKPSPTATESKSAAIEATSNLNTDDKPKVEDQLMFSPSKAKESNPPMIPFDDNNFGRSDFSIPTTDIQPNLSTFSFPVDNLFQQDFKEDSTKESMDLVSKLRQKFKKQQPDEVRVNENDPQVIELDTSPDNTMDTCNEISHVGKMSEPMQGDQIRTDDGVDDADRDDNKEENKLNHTISVPSDERWVPPSSQSSNITSSADEMISNADDHKSKSSFQSDLSASQDFIKQKAFSASVRAEYRTESHMIRDSDENDRSPYIRSFNDKWTENEMIQTRRSVSSSPSLASECNEEEMLQPERPPCQLNQQQPSDLNDRSSSAATDVHSFSSLHYQKQSQEQSQQHLHLNNLNNSNHYNGPVSLFPPLGLNIQMPFPSPGTALFPPTSYHQSFSSAVTNQIPRASSVHSQMSTALNKDGLITPSINSSVTYPSNPCGAAFTSSSHNMALTAAIVSPTIAHTPQLSVTTSHADASQSHHNVPTESNKTHMIESTNQSDAQQPQLPLHNRENINNTPIASVKVPYNESELKTLPLKRSTRFVAQQAAQNIQQQLAKSPSKSPSKSPRNPDLLRQQQLLQNQSSGGKGKAASAAEASATRGRGRGPRNATGTVRGGRSRGRGRGKAANNVPIPVLQEFENVANIQTDLSGTVYDLDFDEDLHSENYENLKAMRDRKKSIEHRQDTMLTFRSREPSQSPKFSSSNAHKPRAAFHSDMRDLRPPSPIRRDSISSIAQSHLSPVASIHGVSPAALLAPVDMRTYNSTFDNTNTEAFNNSLLGAFASGTADQTLQEIDLEMEEELQSALKASNSKGKTPDATPALESSTPVIEAPEEIPPIEADTYRRSQVSLFKLKIKGPHANPDNYTSSLQPNPNLDQIPPLLSAPNLAISQIAISGTPGSNLRRMRKKELLRQYWTQDMNNDDVGYSVKPTDHQPPLTLSTQASRSVGIPKAVDSMSSIPTKDDYKDYAVIDMKKRKASMSRELRLLDNPYEIEMPERRRSVCSNASSNASNHLPADKRMTRTKQAQLTPTLKIKIGSMDTLVEVRPPKKRLASLPIPSLEDLKRESMSYRKQIMGEFDQAEKVVKPKKSKSSKGDRESRKEKKRKKHNAEIISSDVSHNSQKLIIRIGKRKTDDRSEEDVDAKKLNNSASTSGDRIITPIRLKIARKSDGEGYVMASESDKSGATGNEKKKKLSNDDSGTAANNNQANDSSSDKQNSENSKLNEGDGNSRTDNVVDDKESSSHDDQKQAVGPNRSNTLPDPASVASNSKNSDEKTEHPSGELTSTDGQQSGTNLQGCQPLPLGKECEVR
ncbi:hypothetical protein HA402_009693 [Bradysia odoriphaga]|nr:hypothetical protein HA402_009693 [Bradysia odoriphaga]